MMTEPTLPEDPAPIAAHAAPRTSARRRVIIIAVAIVAIVAVAVALFVLRPWAQAEEPAAEPTSTPMPKNQSGVEVSLGKCEAPPEGDGSSPGLAPAAADDAFGGWDLRLNDVAATTRFAASEDVREGLTSLALTSSTGGQPPVPERFEQSVPVTTGENLTVAFSSKAATPGSQIEIVLGPNAVAKRLAIPDSAEWVDTSINYTVPKGMASLSVAIEITSVQGEVLIDGVTVQRGGAELLVNGGFEDNSAVLSIDNATLLFDGAPDSRDLNVRSRVAAETTIAWCVSGGEFEYGGVSTFEGGLVQVPVEYDTPGLYTVKISMHHAGQLIERSATFGVVPPRNGVPSGIGIAAHFQGGVARMTNAPATLAMLGADSVRFEVPWQRIEKEPGVYAYPQYIDQVMGAYEAAGMSVLTVPAYYNPNYDQGRTPSTDRGLGAYAAYTGALLSKYPAAGGLTEIYNEYDHTFNTGSCGTSPDCYMRMLVPAAAAAKAANPAATVYGPSTAGMQVRFDWLQPFIAQGGLDHVDVLTFHPYTQPEGPSLLDSQLQELNGMIAAAKPGVDVPISFTEMGWATVDGWVSREEQAAYTAQTAPIALKSGVDSIYWFTLADSGSDRSNYEASFGFFDTASTFTPNTYQPKPSAIALAVSQRMLGGAKFTAEESWAEGVKAYTFTTTDGRTVTAAWAPDAPVALSRENLPEGEITDMNGRPVEDDDSLEVDAEPVYLVHAD